jgi:hypothetical protein
MSRRRPFFVQRRNPTAIDFETAVEIADDADLEDGAWMAMICDLTGMDAGDVASELAARPHMHAEECPCKACAKRRG